MSSVTFGKLLKVRKIKSDKAERAVRAAKNKLIEAEEALDKAIETLEEFREENANIEQRLLQAAMRKGNSKFVFDDMRFQIQETERKEAELAQEVQKAEKNRDAAEQAVVDAKLAFRATLRDIDKTTQLLDKTKTAEQKEAERAAEAALEDIPRSPRSI